jgi:hypothetical protein
MEKEKIVMKYYMKKSLKWSESKRKRWCNTKSRDNSQKRKKDGGLVKR